MLDFVFIFVDTQTSIFEKAESATSVGPFRPHRVFEPFSKNWGIFVSFATDSYVPRLIIFRVTPQAKLKYVALFFCLKRAFLKLNEIVNDTQIYVRYMYIVPHGNQRQLALLLPLFLVPQIIMITTSTMTPNRSPSRCQSTPLTALFVFCKVCS
jgi:hypothetical protein